MLTFAQESKVQQATSIRSTTLGRAHNGETSEENWILHLQRTVGNQAVQRLLDIPQNRTASIVARQTADDEQQAETELPPAIPVSAPKPALGERIRFPLGSDVFKSPTVEAERFKDWSAGLDDLKERGAWVVWMGSPKESSGKRDDVRGQYVIEHWPTPGTNEAVSPGPFPAEDSLRFCVAHYHQHPPLTPDEESQRENFPVGPSESDKSSAEGFDSPGIVRDFKTIDRNQGEVTDYPYGPAMRTIGPH